MNTLYIATWTAISCHIYNIYILSSDGHLTYLISFAQSFVHYHSIAMKLGVNLSKQEESGKFVFIDCLTHLLSGGDLSNDSGPSKKDEVVKTSSSTTSSTGSRIVFSLGRLEFFFFFFCMHVFFGNYFYITSTPVSQHCVNYIIKCIVPLRGHYRNLTDQSIWLSTTWVSCLAWVCSSAKCCLLSATVGRCSSLHKDHAM